MSVRPSISMEQFGSHWTYFDRTWYLSFYRKSAEKIQATIKYDKNNRHFTRRHFPEFFLEWEMFLITVVEKVQTHILWSITFFPKSAVYEIMSNNMVETEATNDRVIWRMRVACCISKATRARTCTGTRTRTHTEICNTYCFSTATMVSQTRLNVIYRRTLPALYLVILLANPIM